MWWRLSNFRVKIELNEVSSDRRIRGRKMKSSWKMDVVLDFFACTYTKREIEIKKKCKARGARAAEGIIRTPGEWKRMVDGTYNRLLFKSPRAAFHTQTGTAVISTPENIFHERRIRFIRGLARPRDHPHIHTYIPISDAHIYTVINSSRIYYLYGSV